MDLNGFLNGRLFNRINKTGLFIFFVICLIALNASYSLAEIHVSNDFSYTYNNITGPGKDKSSLTDGYRYLDILGLNGNGKFGTFDYHFNLGAQFTDDRRTDPQTFLLTNLKAGMTNVFIALMLEIHFMHFLNTASALRLRADHTDSAERIRACPRLFFYTVMQVPGGTISTVLARVILIQ